MKNKNTTWFFFVLTSILFFSGWASTFCVFYLEGACPIWLVFIVFFLAMVFFSLFVILSNNPKMIYAIVIIASIPSVILAKEQMFTMFITWFVAALLFVLAVKRIKKEQQSRVSVEVSMMLRRGIPIIGMALSILIASGFYFSLVEKQKLSIVPKIEIEIPHWVTLKILKIARFIIPAEELVWIQTGITVDEYVEKTVKENRFILKGRDQDLFNEITSQREIALPSDDEFSDSNKNIFVENGRKVLSDQLGIELRGDEQMDLVINELLQRRVNEFLNGETAGAELLPVGAALTMYILLQSIVWFLGFVIFWTAAGLFTILVKLKMINIKKELKDVEGIV